LILRHGFSFSNFAVQFVVVAYPVVNFHSRLGLAVAIPPPQDTDEFFRFAAEPL
jgi:hypothetical protein